MIVRAAFLFLALALAACGGGESKQTPEAKPPPPPADAADAGGPAAQVLAYPAIRCAECHNKMHDEWSTSAHAQAAKSPTYVKMREAAGGPAAGCDDCHAPLAKRLPAGDLASAEGVTCEVCHNIKTVAVRNAGAGYELRLDRVKYGPLCDAKDHYFHRMGCSPLHAEATLCAGCHLYYRTLPGGGELPVYTEYAEWQEGPYQAHECQSCHMPGARAEVADGAGVRDKVGHHGWLGSKQELRAYALAATATVTAAGDKLRVDARIENVNAGHAVPSGQPERRIVVRATAFAPGGAKHAAAEQAFGRILADAAGKPAPFYAATRVLADDRIPAGGSREAHLEVAAPETGELAIEVLWIPIDPEIAARLVIPAAAEVRLLRARVMLKPPQGGKRPDLPRTIGLER
jgi:hypothetical protein